MFNIPSVFNTVAHHTCIVIAVKTVFSVLVKKLAGNSIAKITYFKYRVGR